MQNQPPKKSFLVSLILHVMVLIILVAGFDHVATIPVIQNTNEHDIVSAVILGDTEKSKIVPVKLEAAEPQITPTQKTPPPEPVPEKAEVIAIKKPEKKLKIKPAFSASNLLADMEKVNKKQIKSKQTELKKSFEKTLKQHAEQTLRQQLFDEEIKLKTAEERRSQGQVDKYKALIIQSISEHWVVPTQANKKLYCELMIRVAPGGMVLDVQVTKSSGDPSLDRSARAAVLQASPLPVPREASAFSAFRQFVLKVRPENMV